MHVYSKHTSKANVILSKALHNLLCVAVPDVTDDMFSIFAYGGAVNTFNYSSSISIIRVSTISPLKGNCSKD